MRRILVAFILTCLTLVLCFPARAAGWTAEATPLDLIAGPVRTAAFLAPDGSRFAYITGDDLCLYSLEGEKGNCVTLDKDIRMDLDTVRWSPDGTKLAFSEDFMVTFRDSDIWLYDTTSNTIEDMTPAPNRDLKMFANSDPTKQFTVDMIPQWSSDGKSIYFIRYTFSQMGDAVPFFYKVDISSKNVEEVADPQTKFALSTYGFAVSPDDSKIAFNVDKQGKGQEGNFLLDLTTKESKFAAAAIQDTLPWYYQFSPDGKQILVIGMNKKGVFLPLKPEASPIYTLPIFGGRQQQLNIDTYVYAAGWGPEGSGLAYTTFDPDHTDKEGLYITSAPGQAGELVLPGSFVAPSSRNLTPIFWASNNTLLLSQGPDFKLVVVHLKQS